MEETKRIQKSRKLAQLLRFDKSYPFLVDGWREVANVLSKLNISLQDIKEIVENDSKNQDGGKGRFELSEDETMIRARDGHAKWMPLSPKKPSVNYPELLYHGTSLRFVGSILKKGIDSRNRAYVHLSSDLAEAIRVGARHNNPFVLRINTQTLVEKGYELYPPESLAWFANYVPADAIDAFAYIGQSVTYYEYAAQADSVLARCNDPQTLQGLIDKLTVERNSMICPVENLESVSTICQNIHIENDIRSKRIMAYMSVPVDIDEQSYKQITEDLSSLIDVFRSFYLANILMDNMPVVVVDKKRALYYLEMSSRYNEGNRNTIRPIDWFDVKKFWEKSRSFRFFPTFSSETLNGLVERLPFDTKEYIGRPGRRGVLWIDVPEECDDNMSDIHEIIWRFRERGYMILLGISSITGQKDFKAILCLMEG